MSQIITINSVNYDGELANVLFTPDNDPVVINLGDVTLPFVFEPSLLNPPREVYGTYTIYTYVNKCTNFLNVPRPTPTPTPTVTPTRTQTPTPTPTVSPTPTFNPCLVPTNTPTPTTTPTNTPTVTPTPSVTCTSPCGCPKPSMTPTSSKTPRPTLTCTSPCGCTVTPTPTNTNTPTPTVTPTNNITLTPTPTNTNTPTVTPTNTNTPTVTPTKTNTPTPTNTITPTSTVTPTNTNTPTPTNTTTNTPTPTVTPTNTITNTPTPTVTTTATPTNTVTNTPTPTSTDTPTPTPTITPTITPTPTATPLTGSIFNMRLFESGSDVIMSGIGEFNIADLTFFGPGNLNGSVRPNNANFFCGEGNVTQLSSDAYVGATLTKPNNFGSGVLTQANTGNGVAVGIQNFGATVGLTLPTGYVSNTTITTKSTFNEKTLSSLGATTGTYYYTWGSGVNIGNLVLQIG